MKAPAAPELLIVEEKVDQVPLGLPPDDTGDGTYGASYRSGSVYFDAYEGNEARDHMSQMANYEIEDKTMVTMEGKKVATPDELHKSRAAVSD